VLYPILVSSKIQTLSFAGDQEIGIRRLRKINSNTGVTIAASSRIIPVGNLNSFTT